MFRIVQVSDLHLRAGWHEEQGIILDALWADLATQDIARETDLFVFSGDLVQAGENTQYVTEFVNKFGPNLDSSFQAQRRIFTPGNHDVSRKYVAENLALLKPLAGQADDETTFNDMITEGQPVRNLIAPKFSSILSLVPAIFGCSVSNENLCGAGFTFSADLSVYVLNSALYSFGGARDQGTAICDQKKLRVETRGLRKWLSENAGSFKVLVMHHPVDWLVPWAKSEMAKIAQNEFSLLLQGHEHSPTAYASIRAGQVITCSAPALHTHKADHELGYSIITVDPNGQEVRVAYRQWAPRDQRFVTGSALSGTDDGVLPFPYMPSKKRSSLKQEAVKPDPVKEHLSRRFDASLSTYKSLGTAWIEPELARKPDFDLSNEDPRLTPIQALSSSKAIIITAPQLFGLTSLGHYLCREWWTAARGGFLLYSSVSEFPGHVQGILDFVTRQLRDLGVDAGKFAGVVLDCNGALDQLGARRMNSFTSAFPDKNLIVLRTMDFRNLGAPDDIGSINCKPITYYLLGMDRSRIRALVREEISAGAEFDEDRTTQRVIDDLELLNIHRTPLNVKTLLALVSHQIDNSPVNRTEMLSQYLYLVFENNVNLRYEIIPDLKDSTYAIGEFCAKLLRDERCRFTKHELIACMEEYCKGKAVDLDVDVIFRILERERVIVQIQGEYEFHYMYWVYFFAAHHMYASSEFANFVISERRYSNYPEVIEFYSGIDRQRLDLIQSLTADLRELRLSFEEATKIPRYASVHDLMKWEMSEKAAENLEERLNKFLSATDLPIEIKDRIADANYDYSKPYTQQLRRSLAPQSIAKSVFVMVAAARALRNSDHVGKEPKHDLLVEVLLVWKRLVQVATVVAPDLVRSQRATYEDITFLAPGFRREGEDPGSELVRVLSAVPRTFAHMFFSDLTTKRMGPLFESVLANEQDQTLRLFVSVQLLLSKPRHWVRWLSQYVSSLERNSFYLLDFSKEIQRDYRVGFNSAEEKTGLRELLVKIVSSHQLKNPNPNKKTSEKIEQELIKKLEQDPPPEPNAV